MRFLLTAVVLLPWGAFAQDASPADHAFAVYKTGDYKTAIPLLQSAVQANPKDAKLHAALLSSLVYEGRVDEASDEADAEEEQFPNAPEALAARGEWAFYMGDMEAAPRLFNQALKLQPNNARACFGLAQFASFASMYRTARMFSLRAHENDPDDALLTQRFFWYVPKEKREPQLSQFIAAHPWFYKNFEEYRQWDSDVSHELKGKSTFELDGERKEVTLKLIPMLSDANRAYGVGLEFAIESGRSLRLLFDTGASGILLNQQAVDKAELDHVGNFHVSGIGSDGERTAFGAVADFCTVDTLKFKRCLLNGIQGKRKVVSGEDGLIGADFFQNYVIEIDFQNMLLHLMPLPELPQAPQWSDREIPPDEQDWTRVFRTGGHLYVPTLMNGKTQGVFLIDTGAFNSIVDSAFAKLSMKVHKNSDVRIRGVSGEVKKVFQADKAVIQFAHYEQENFGLTVFDLNNQPGHQDFRISGILGAPVLSMFHIKIDYRNGLVKFVYFMGEKKKG